MSGKSGKFLLLFPENKQSFDFIKTVPDEFSVGRLIDLRLCVLFLLYRLLEPHWTRHWPHASLCRTVSINLLCFFSPIMLCVAAAWLCSCVHWPDDNVCWLLSSPPPPPPLFFSCLLLRLFNPRFSPPPSISTWPPLLSSSLLVLLFPPFPRCLSLLSVFLFSFLSLSSLSRGRPWAEEAEGKSVFPSNSHNHSVSPTLLMLNINTTSFLFSFSVQHRPCGSGRGSLWIQEAAEPLEVTDVSTSVFIRLQSVRLLEQTENESQELKLQSLSTETFSGK